MATLQEIVEQVSVDLNDNAAGYEFTTWSETQLQAYVIEGLQVAFTVRPDLFMSAMVVELEAGTSLQRPCTCTKIRRIYGISTKDGRLLYGLRKRKNSDSLQWYGSTCRVSPKNYRARDYYIDSQGGTFYIEPAPPVGQTLYALIECAQIPDPSDFSASSEIADELVAPAIQWALYRAKMVDSENNTAIFAVAKEHKSTFFGLLNVQLQMHDAVELDRSTPQSVSQKVVAND